MRGAGINVNTNVEEGERVLAQENKISTNHHFASSNDEFERIRDIVIKENGVVSPDLSSKNVNVVVAEGIYNGNYHPFQRLDDVTLLKKEVKTYARNHRDAILGDVTNAGGVINVSIKSIGEMVDPKSINKSEKNGVSKDVHLSAIVNIKNIIKESVDCEVYPDYEKGNDGRRVLGNKVSSTSLMHVFYGAFEMDGHNYSVRMLVKETKGSSPNKAYMYSLEEIELSSNTEAVDSALHREKNNSIPLAKIIEKIEKSKDIGKNLLEESKKTVDIFERVRRVGQNRGLSLEEIKMRVGTRLTNNNYTKVRSINPFIGLLQSDRILPHLPYREVFTEPSLDDYFIGTRASFEYIGSNLAMMGTSDSLVHAGLENNETWAKMVASGKYEHQKSPRSNSEYLLDRETGDIYRYSNHWGRVASCEWNLDKRYGTEDTEIYSIGKCNIKDFSVNRVFSSYMADNPAYGPAYEDALQKTIANYETLLSSDVEMTPFVRTRLENVLAEYKVLSERFTKENFIAPRWSGVRYQYSNVPVYTGQEARRIYDEILESERLRSVEVNDQMRQDVMQGQPMFFRNGERQAYGFVHNDSIYIDPRIATAETPIHEYTHLWAEVLRQRNPQEWKSIVQLMKGTPEVWEKVRMNYPTLKTDDQIADEALAQYSGHRGYEKLMALAEQETDTKGILQKMSEALERFWHSVADFLHIHYTSKEQVADQILKDMLSQMNPLDYRHNVVLAGSVLDGQVDEDLVRRMSEQKIRFTTLHSIQGRPNTCISATSRNIMV